MKTKRENTVSKQATLKKVLKCKKTLTPKAGSSLEKAVKNVQEIVKKKQLKTSVKTTPIIKFKPSSKPVKPTIKEKLPKDRGVVYVGHIPHGFYEEQMKDYFQQFGRVTRVRVARSKKTGANRGYGFVEFLHTNVAKIAAETMNNYLMCGRLLKATYIPPDKQHPRYFLGPNWSKEKYPALINRRKTMIHKNKSLSDEEYITYVKTSLNKLSTLEKKLKSKGFNIKFQPRDVPCTGLK